MSNRIVIFLILFSSNFAYGSDDVSEKILSVEQNLRPSVLFVKDQPWSIQDRMAYFGVPGLTIAVIENHKVAWLKAYGVKDKGSKAKVNKDTLFQAGSISKPVTAWAALKMVEQNQFQLDKPVNEMLKGWKIPENKKTSQEPVTPLRIINHSAGLSVPSFLGYRPGREVPSLQEVLNGNGPANSSAVIVKNTPGKKYKYSGGGYTVLQKLMMDIEGKEFPELMSEKVLIPANMLDSTYEQPLPESLVENAATGYLPNNKEVIGKRHTYPEMAAAGLWTTASDLAKFVIDIQRSLKNDSGVILSKEMANKMTSLTIDSDVALGLFLRGSEKENLDYFYHSGWDEGFSAFVIGHKINGNGVVILSNSNHPEFITELVNSVADTYAWPGFSSTIGFVGKLKNTLSNKVLRFVTNVRTPFLEELFF